MQNRVNSEEELCVMLARYLRVKHPDVPFHFDYGSGLKMTMGQAVRQKRLNVRAWPDLFIAQPTGGVIFKDFGAGIPSQTHQYAGLFLELKRENTRLKKKNGDWASEHIEEQALTLDTLAEQGYIAQFAKGYDEAVELIESYLAGTSLGAREGEAS